MVRCNRKMKGTEEYVEMIQHEREMKAVNNTKMDLLDRQDVICTPFYQIQHILLGLLILISINSNSSAAVLCQAGQ